jgi:hypothetical protein
MQALCMSSARIVINIPCVLALLTMGVFHKSVVAQPQIKPGEVYKTIDQKQVITIVSSDKLELYTSNINTNLICEYYVQGNRLRVVATILGTQQALYYDVTDQGLVDKEGTILFSPQHYAKTIEAIRLSQKRQGEERQRIAEVVKKSKEKTTIIEKFELSPRRYSSGNTTEPIRATITDVSIDLDFTSLGHQRTREVGYFANLLYIRRVGQSYRHSFYVGFSREDDQSGVGFFLYAKTHADAQAVQDALLRAFNKWSLKYPEAVPKNAVIEK